MVPWKTVDDTGDCLVFALTDFINTIAEKVFFRFFAQNIEVVSETINRSLAATGHLVSPAVHKSVKFPERRNFQLGLLLRKVHFEKHLFHKIISEF